MAMIRVDLQVETDARPPVTGLAKNALLVFNVLKNPALLMIVLAVIGGGVWAYRQSKALSEQTAALSAEIDQQQRDSVKFAKELSNAEKLKKQQKEYEKLVAKIRNVDDNRFAFVHVMDEAARAVPPESWIQSIKTDKEDPATRNISVSIKGFAPTESAVTEYVQKLNESPWLTNAAILKVAKVPINRQTLVGFELTMDTEIPDPSFLQMSPISQLFGATIPNDMMVPVSKGAVAGPTSPPEPAR